MKRSEMIEKIAGAFMEKLSDPYSIGLSPDALEFCRDWNLKLFRSYSEVALKACEDAGLLPPCTRFTICDCGAEESHDWEPEESGE